MRVTSEGPDGVVNVELIVEVPVVEAEDVKLKVLEASEALFSI